MLEDPLKMLKSVSDNLMELVGENAKKEFDERKKSQEKTIAALTRIIDDAKNPIEIKLMASDLIKLESEITLSVAERNYGITFLGLTVSNTAYALAMIDSELTQLKPAKQTTEDVERIKLLEENIANLKMQLETMKPLFARVKKDIAARKKYLNAHR